MDDLIPLHSIKGVSYEKVGRYIEHFVKEWTKESPRKCQLFKTSLQYMRNEIFIESKKVCMKPLRHRLEAIQ